MKLQDSEEIGNMKSPAAEPFEPIRTAFNGFGTDVRLVVWPSIGMDGEARAALARETRFLRLAEKRLSRFLPDSELSHLNNTPETAVRVSRLTFKVIATALAAAEATGGLFDPSVGNALSAAGYNRTFADLKGSTGVVAGQTCDYGGASCDFRQVRLDSKRSQVTLPRSVSLDLGGIAKGWLADRAVRRLARYGAALADLGGDIAFGSPPPGGFGWRIEVEDPGVSHGSARHSYRPRWRRGNLRGHPSAMANPERLATPPDRSAQRAARPDRSAQRNHRRTVGHGGRGSRESSDLAGLRGRRSCHRSHTRTRRRSRAEGREGFDRGNPHVASI